MLRTLARACSNLRYFPRNLFAALARLQSSLDTLAAQRDPPPPATNPEIATFCDDATKLLMDLNTRLARLEQTQSPKPTPPESP